MKTRAEMKTRAKEVLGNNIFSSKWMMYLLVGLVVTAVTTLLSGVFFEAGSIQNMVIASPQGELHFNFVGGLSPIASIFQVILFVTGGAIATGFATVSLRIVRNLDEQASFAHIIDGFKQGFGWNFLTNLLVSLYTFLWSLLLIVPGIIKAYSYALTFYIRADNPEIGPNDAITLSKKMMKGHKWQLFVLELSFLGWYIVGSLCLGVGTLWVNAYEGATKAIFYEEVKKEYEGLIDAQTTEVKEAEVKNIAATETETK